MPPALPLLSTSSLGNLILHAYPKFGKRLDR